MVYIGGNYETVNRYEEDENDVLTAVANSLYEYNANNAVTSITHNNATGSQIVKHSYTYDETNNIIEYLNSLDGSTEYNYDFLGQLIGADHANQNLDDETYSYDENGNRITANGSNYTTGDNNELTSDGTWTYTYDAEGNRISKTNAANTERELYMWDYRNRLTTVTKQTYDTLTNEWTTVQIVEYSYDYNNVWIRKTLDTNGDGIADSKTIFIPENYQTTVQLDDTDLTDATGPVVTHHYLWTPNQQDKLLADTTASGILWALTDHLGTIRDVLDGNSSTHLIYDAFGNLTSGTNPLLFGYTGKPFDNATNLQNNINRWYDATIGRWLSTDPIGFEGNDTNLYRYVGNSPLTHIDITGLKEFRYLTTKEKQFLNFMFNCAFNTTNMPEQQADQFIQAIDKVLNNVKLWNFNRIEGWHTLHPNYTIAYYTFLNPDIGAITFGNDIYFPDKTYIRGGNYKNEGQALIGHELFHSLHVELANMGVPVWAGIYLLDSLSTGLIGGDPYLGNYSEVGAYAFGNTLLDILKSHHNLIQRFNEGCISPQEKKQVCKTMKDVFRLRFHNFDIQYGLGK